MALETQYYNTDSQDFWKKEISTGTTIMAVKYNGGVVIGADSRTTSGSYIVSRVTDKLTKVTDNIYCCRSGSAADTQAVADIVTYRMNLFQMENNEPPTVYAAACVFREICYNYRDQLLAGIICAGWDKKKGGQVYNLPLGGALIEEDFSIGGSGSGYIYGFVDANRKPDMTEAECVKLVLEAVTLAIDRDGSSGGCVRIATIDKDGCRRKLFLGNELPKFNQ